MRNRGKSERRSLERSKKARRRRLGKPPRRTKRRKRRRLLYSRTTKMMRSMSVKTNKRRCLNKMHKREKQIMARRSPVELL